jgi:two-component system OmpR family sensor kinase
MHDRLFKRWNSVSLRTKITGVTVLMLTFGLVVSGVGTMVVLRTYLINQVETRLDAAARDPSAFLGPEARTPDFSLDDIKAAPKDYYVALYSPTGGVLASNVADDDDAPKPTFDSMDLSETNSLNGDVFSVHGSSGQSDWRAVSIVVYIDNVGTQGTLVIAQSLQTTENTTTTYLSIFLAFGIGVVVLGAMLTRLLVTSTFGALRQVERTAAAIADGDFSQRMADATPNTEVGRLNGSLNTMLSRIDRAFNDRARTIDQMRRFVGDASHELRTPLVSVRGYAELYRMGALQTPEEVAQAMDRIEKEAIRMGSLVEDLLELARLDETKPLALTPVNLIPIAMDAALDARASSPGRVIRVVTSRASDPVVTFNPVLTSEEGGAPLPPKTLAANNATGPIAFAGATLARLRSRRPAKNGSGQLITGETGDTKPVVPLSGVDSAAAEPDDADLQQPLVLAEENKIRQVLANLIGNALRFTPADSPIELVVSIDELSRLAMVYVVDHGEGIPPQIREKIFQRFWRADTSRARETGGSGLGLAIVSSIVAAHRGTVQALETPGGGATFRISLPLLIEKEIGKPSPDSSPRL